MERSRYKEDIAVHDGEVSRLLQDLQASREDDENYLIRRILSRNGHGTHLDMRVRLRRHTTKESECSLIAGL